MDTPGARPVVTLSAAYGAGGSRVGPLVADELGVPFVDRAISTGLVDRLGLSPDYVAAMDDSGPSGMSRTLASLAVIGAGMTGADVHAELLGDRSFCEATEGLVRSHAGPEGAVILGRAGAIVLREHPTALHVRLDGPLERRIAAAVAIEGVDERTAERRARENDAARAGYVRNYYRCDATDPTLYDLVLDSTRLPLDLCAGLIATAARALVGNAPVAARRQ
jgi:cytidylate kinase